MRRWLRLWFAFQDPVDRRTYLLNGAGLMLFKYAVDTSLVGVFAHRLWTPLDYANPVWSLRERLLQNGPAWLAPSLVVWTLPFLWIGVSLTARRAVDAGRSPWWALLFFAPIVNYAALLWLGVQPSRPAAPRSLGATPRGVDPRWRAGLQGVGAAAAIAIPTVLLGVYWRHMYSTGLFLGTPFTIGYVSGHVFNAGQAQSVRRTIEVALVGVGLAGGALLLFALEGALCIALALPLAALLAVCGAVLGRAIVLRGLEPPVVAGALLAPLLVLANPEQAAAPHDVTTVVDVMAPPAIVWQHVIHFPALAPAREWPFRAGVAAPVAARIEGSGVGATRYCDFTTGTFVEPITAWEEARRLGFDITAQPLPMREWSPYRGVHPPHLDGYFRATHGEFRLVPLAGGRTRLEGSTRYTIALFPQAYWTLPARWLVAAIHQRVLRHIKALAERDAHS